MANIFDDTVRCPNCGCTQFEEKVVVTLPTTIRPRDYKETQFPTKSREYKYVCETCGETLDK